MAFINALVNSPEDIEVRLSLRNDFLNIGLSDIIARLKNCDNEILKNQLYIFEDEANADYKEFCSSKDPFPEIEILDPKDIFSTLLYSSSNNSSYPHFLKSLQTLLFTCKVDAKRRPYYWNLISTILQGIMIQGNNVCFSYEKISLSVYSWIESLATQAEFLEIKKKNEEYSGELLKYQKIMEGAEIKFLEVEKQSKEYEKKLETFRHKYEILEKEHLGTRRSLT
jgi:diaphanous 2